MDSTTTLPTLAIPKDTRHVFVVELYRRLLSIEYGTYSNAIFSQVIQEMINEFADNDAIAMDFKTLIIGKGLTQRRKSISALDLLAHTIGNLLIREAQFAHLAILMNVSRFQPGYSYYADSLSQWDEFIFANIAARTLDPKIPLVSSTNHITHTQDVAIQYIDEADMEPYNHLLFSQDLEWSWAVIGFYGIYGCSEESFLEGGAPEQCANRYFYVKESLHGPTVLTLAEAFQRTSTPRALLYIVINTLLHFYDKNQLEYGDPSSILVLMYDPSIDSDNPKRTMWNIPVHVESRTCVACDACPILSGFKQAVFGKSSPKVLTQSISALLEMVGTRVSLPAAARTMPIRALSHQLKEQVPNNQLIEFLPVINPVLQSYYMTISELEEWKQSLEAQIIQVRPIIQYGHLTAAQRAAADYLNRFASSYGLSVI